MLLPVRAADAPDLARFLRDADLTVAGLDAPGLRCWIERDVEGAVVGSTGYEASDDGAHVLVRSVAVAPDRRAGGHGSRLARFALDRAAESGATTAWLFSRRSGPFWQGLGFVPADLADLAGALATTQQVQLFARTGQLGVERAWSRPLVPAS